MLNTWTEHVSNEIVLKIMENKRNNLYLEPGRGSWNFYETQWKNMGMFNLQWNWSIKTYLGIQRVKLERRKCS